MRLELQQIGALCVALFFGGLVSLCLFLVMTFLIEPERTVSHSLHPYEVTFVAMGHENKPKNAPEKRIEIKKPSSKSKPIAIRADVPKKVTRKKISVRLPEIEKINVSGGGGIHDLNLRVEMGQFDYSKDNHNVQFSGVERKYSTFNTEKTQAPERFRTVSGGEIDRIGNDCYEVPSAGGIGSSDTGQTAVEKDQVLSMRSLFAHQVPCNKINNSFAQDFLKQLKKRGLIKAPVSVTK